MLDIDDENIKLIDEIVSALYFTNHSKILVFEDGDFSFGVFVNGQAPLLL